MTFYLSDSPEAPGNLILEPALTLEWTRPIIGNIPGPENVNISYTVVINSTEDNGLSYQNVTSMTSLSVHFVEEIISAQGSQCVEFEFIVSATNDAGTGPSTSILDTVPICKSTRCTRSFIKAISICHSMTMSLCILSIVAPDVTNIDSKLQVERVDLQTSTATVEISFPVSDGG